MGQKAKNAGKKKSKVSSRVSQGNQILCVKGSVNNPPSKEFLEEVDAMVKYNFSISSSRQGYRGRRIMRSTDLCKTPCVFKPSIEKIDEIWNKKKD